MYKHIRIYKAENLSYLLEKLFQIIVFFWSLCE